MSSSSSLPTYSLSDLSSHTVSSSAWLAIDGSVYDVTSFLAVHPGGEKILLKHCGKDASKEFHSYHSPSTLSKYVHLKIGLLAAQQDKPKKAKSSDSRLFGEMVPFGDPPINQGYNSPYYKPEHFEFQRLIREFLDREVAPHCFQWEDEQKSVPRPFVAQLLAKHGYLQGAVGFYPLEYSPSHIGSTATEKGIPGEKFDYFMGLIGSFEAARSGCSGVMWGLTSGLCIGMPPVYYHGSDALKEKVCRPCFNGDKTICLAITEPEGGSDVANLRTTAQLTEDGKYYRVNGVKKWITNGVYADYFTTAVRTGSAEDGPLGVSLLLIERGPGVKTSQMKCQGVWASGTAMVVFEDVLVPVENLIGQENIGFLYVMQNFNHERWASAVTACSLARVCVEESFRYSFKRKTFGKYLIEHPVIRLKLADMARKVEMLWSHLENLTYQMQTLKHSPQGEKMLGGSIALAKASSSDVLEFCARESAQIFGGLAYTRGGQGEKVERIYRDVLAYKIPAGSAEVLLDLGIREVGKLYKKRIGHTAKL